MRRQTKSSIAGFVVGESRRSSICVDNGLTGSRYLHQLEYAYVCVVCCCCQEQSLSLAATNSVRLIFVLPCHESALLRLLVNKVTTCVPARFSVVSPSIARVVRIIGWHLCVRSRVICVFVAQRFSVAFRLWLSRVDFVAYCIDNIFLLYSHITDIY